MTDVGADDILEGLHDNVDMARNRAVGGLSDDPEEAARALRLAQFTGVPATAIHGDVDQFVSDQNARATSFIVRNNPIIADYINSHPLAASVSNDDYAQLDNISRAADAFDNKTWLQKFHEFVGPEKGDYSLYTPQGREAAAKVFKGFPEAFTGFGQRPFGGGEGATPIEKATGLYSRPSDIEYALSHPGFQHILAGRLVGLGELGAEGVARFTNGLINVGRDNIATVFGEGTANVFDNAAQALIDPATQAFLMSSGVQAVAPAAMLKGVELFGDFLKAFRTVDRYRKIGKETPPGVDPIVDEAKKFQAKEDKQKLNDIISEVRKSSTAERTPDLFLNNFLRRKLEGEIGIDAEAAKKLYGDEIPAPDDGKLGSIPGMAAQLENAKLTGDDIRVPMADWVTKVAKENPELHNELADDLRLRPDGYTINDTKLKVEPKEVIDDPLAQAKGSAGLEPLAMAGDRKVTLRKKGESTGPNFVTGVSETKFHDVDILDENGKTIGTINLSEQKGGKQLYVEMIQAGSKQSKFYQPNFLGPALIKDMKRQLKAMFPNAETITGHRVSGAREKAGSFYGPTASPEVKLQLTDDPQGFRDLLQPYWEPISAQAQVLRGGFTPMQQAVADAVQAEAQRIVPSAEVESVGAIHYPKAGGFAQGLFQPSTAKMFVSLERLGTTPERQLGSLRHEAIHYLYRSGFLSDAEWSTLTKAAQDENWRGRFGIDQRYRNFSEEIRNEEAIAEAYRSWKLGESVTKDPTIFQKISDFMDRVRRRISTALGRELSWEDIFKEIDEGRVGRRELEEPGAEGEALAMASEDDKIAYMRRAANENVQLSPREMRRLKSDLTYKEFQEFQADLDRKIAERKAKEKPSEPWVKLPAAQQPERVASATYKIGDRVFEGPNHVAAMDAAAKELAISGTDELIDRQPGANLSDKLKAHADAAGFKTTAGRIIDRAEAAKLAEESGQGKATRPGSLKMEDLGEEPLAMVGEGPEFHPLYDKGKALGITDRSLRIREKLIQQANAEDYQWDKRKNEARLGKTFRAEVKARRVTLRDEVRDNITQRPDVAIDQLFAAQKIKLDPATLSEEQKARLPKDYIQKKNGVNPDELAPYFGYASGDALVERLGMLTENRRSTGLSPRDYLNRLIDVETDRRLNQEFGDREANIHANAAAQALSNTRLQLAHQDTLDYAAKAGAVATPSPEVGKIRFYHGTAYEDAKGFTGKTFVSPHYDYAKNYHGDQNNVLYADFTKEEAIRRGLYDEVNNFPINGSIDDGAAQLNRHVSPEEASKSGLKAPYSHEDMKIMAQKNFDGIAAGVVSKDSFMQNALRLSNKIGDADIQGKWAESYRLMQKREFTLLHAKLAVGFEKLQDQVERFAKTYVKRPTKEVARRIDQDYYNFLQGLFARYGYRIGRTAEQLADAVEQGNYSTLPDLIRDKRQHLREIDAPEFVTDPSHPSFKKGLKDLTTEEYTQLHRFIKQMDFNARDEKKINVEGQAADLDDTIDQMIEGMPDSLPAKTISGAKKNLVKEIPKSFWWGHITIRSMAKRLDRGDPRGLFTRLLADRATQADATYSSLRRQYMKRLEDIGKKPDMDKIVENTLFHDPNTGELIPMRKRNVYAAIANWGNDSNRTKFLKGYGVEQAPAEAWLRQNSKPEDWEAHQAIGGVFAEVFKMASNMARDVSGVGIDALPLQKFIDPHGIVREGWYNPVEYHDMLPGKSKALLSAGAVEEPGYFRATTTDQRYAKARTGYIAPMDLTLDAIPIRLDQMLHDIAWRPALIDMGKIIENEKFQNAVISRYGLHQKEEFKSFLRDMANGSNVDSLAEYYRETMLEYFRRNTVASLIGLNPGTYLKHTTTAGMNSLTQVGPVNFSREFVQMFRRTPAYAERQFKMAYEKSEVIQDRAQNITRLIRGTDPKFSFEPGKFGWWRETMMHVGSAPVAFGDLVTAVPTWLAEYKKQIAAGADEGFSIQAADKAVIEAHGSSLSSNLPSVMRQGGSMARMYSSLYGFFSHILQKQYEFAWKAKDIWNGEKPLDIGAGSWAPHMLNNLWSYWIFPALIEEMVTPWTNKEHESWGKKAAKWGLLGATSSVSLVRDLGRALLGAPGDPAPGIISTSMKDITDLGRDIARRQPLSKEHTGKLIKDAVASVAVATGLTNAQEGKTGEYIYRYARGLERPKGPWDLATGLRYGKTEGHSRSFAEWWKYMTK